MLDFLFGFLLAYQPVVAVTIFATIIIILINIFYRILINQSEAKQLKDNVRELNKQMKEVQKAGDMEKTKQLMGEVMRENSKLMRMTMKPMIVSFIIIILFLPWLAVVYNDIFVPIDNNGLGNLTISENMYKIEKDGSNVKIGELNVDCNMPCTERIEDFDWKIHEEDKDIKFARAVVKLPIAFPIFGEYLGWLGWYILISIPIMIIVRKLLKINV
jgi:uncharacterized membrane protein (DUF106 family)